MGSGGICFECHEPLGEGAFDRIEISDEVVGEAVLAKRLPEVFGRVEFGAVWRQENQPHVGRHAQFACQVPARLVHDHHHKLLGMALGYLGQEQRHRLGVDPRQHQTVHHAVVRADRAEGIDVFALKPGAHHGSRVVRRPAAAGRAQQPEAPLVMEHQPYAATLLSLARDLLAYLAANFF